MCNRSDFSYIRMMALIPFLFQLFLAENSLCYPCKDEPANGETKSQVTAKCGEPVSSENRTVKTEEIDEQGNVSTTTKDVTELIYGPGSDNLVQLFRFEDDHLVQIKNVGYGKLNDFTNDICRNGESLRVGDTMAETFLKCGNPLSRESREPSIVEIEIPGKIRRTFIPVVEWTYRYGPKLPGYTVTFEDGVATNIRTREFGK